MNAQEREAWVGYGIDQSANVMMLFRHDVIVFAAKWNDCEIQPGICQAAHAVAMQSCAIDDKVRLNGALGSFDDGNCAGTLESDNLMREVNHTTQRGYELRILFRDLGIIHNTRAWHLNSLNSGSMRFDFANLIAMELA